MSKQKIIAGIDIGSSKTTTLIASLGEEGEKPKVIGVASIPSQGIRKGQIVDIEEASETVVQSVEAAERMAGYNLNRAFVAVNGAHINSQNSKGVVAVAEPEGEITQEDVKRVIDAAQAVSLPSSREIIHVLPRYYTADGQEGIKDPMGMSGVRLEIETHIITGSTTSIRNLTKCVSEMGVDVQDLVAGGLASAESVLSDTEKELGVVLVDIGGGTTNIVVYVEGAVFYTSVLPIGAKNVTNDLAIGLRLSSLQVAEKIKIVLSTKAKRPTLPNLGAEQLTEIKKEEKKQEKDEEKDEDEIDLAKLGITEEARTVSRKTLTEGIIKPRLNEIFTMVGMEIKKSNAGGLTPAGIVVCGGGAQTVGVVDAAKRILAMPVRIGQPQRLNGLVDDILTSDFATATGLVLYGARADLKPGVSFSFSRISKKFQKLPVKGIAGKALNLIKSFLP
ncbi:MAG TPA: cell division protein FtsA [Nevskiaceae bacterium]|nr:cell division protein FtsA [Nevskiaceae bacterium]